VIDREFQRFRERTFRLYTGGRYADALALVERESSRFPARWGDTLYWRGCLTAVMGDRENALRLLEEAVERGHWWSEATLRGEPDFTALRGDARFEALIEACRGRHARAEAGARAELFTFSPRADPPWPLVIALHGSGGEAEEFAERWQPAVAAGWLLAVPQSSGLVAPGRFGWGDRDRARREIGDHYQALVRQHPVDRDRVIVAGFSQGGATAVWLALAGALPARGFVGVACAARDLDEVRALAGSARARGIRGYLVVGDRDYVFQPARDLVEVLGAAGVAARLETGAGLGHEMPADFEPGLLTGLQFVAGSPGTREARVS
jgi:predicted esterase